LPSAESIYAEKGRFTKSPVEPANDRYERTIAKLQSELAREKSASLARFEVIQKELSQVSARLNNIQKTQRVMGEKLWPVSGHENAKSGEKDDWKAEVAKDLMAEIAKVKNDLMAEIAKTKDDLLAETDILANRVVDASKGRLSSRVMKDLMKDIHQKLRDKIDGARKGLKQEARRLADRVADARKVRVSLEKAAKHAKHAGGKLKNTVGGMLDKMMNTVKDALD